MPKEQRAPELEAKLEKTNRLLAKLARRKSLPYRFLAGLFHGLGTTVGLALVFALFAYLLRKVELIPLIGGWISQVINVALSQLEMGELVPVR